MSRKFIESFYVKPEQVRPHVYASEEGLQVVCGEEIEGSVCWSEIAQIVAHKYDNFSYDEICARFSPNSHENSWLEISEEWEGVFIAKQQREEKFPSISKE